MNKFSPIPKKYAGKWIAMDAKRNEIVATGKTLAQTVKAAAAKGEKNPQLMKMPPGLFTGVA